MLPFTRSLHSHLDDTIRGRFIAGCPNSARNLVLGSRGHVANGRVVDRVAAVNAENQADFWHLPLHQAVDELVHQSVARHQQNALVLVRLVCDGHVLGVGCE